MNEKNGSSTTPWESLPKHHDEDQVRLDVDRSFIWYPYGTYKSHNPHDLANQSQGQSEKQLLSHKQQLSDLITEVLRRYPYLHYFQGYHDICQVFLLVLPPPSRVPAVSRLSALRIRDFMLPTLAPALSQLRLIPSILLATNPKLYYHLSQTQPFFALSPTLTMYAHDIQEYGAISRLFDVLLAQSPVFSVYMFAQIVLQRADELFETPADEPEMLHSILSKLPQPLDVEALIQNTIHLFSRHPPESLSAWRTIPRYSVLRTARSPNESLKQSLADGEAFFHKQVRELAWIEKRDKLGKQLYRYRKPVGTVGLAVLIGVLSFYMRKPAASGLLSMLWKYLGGGTPR